MDTPSASMRELARRLIALEAASRAESDSHVREAALVCEKLGASLTRFAGADGFTALLRRAVALARADIPSLAAVRVMSDGRLEGFEEVMVGEPDGGDDAGAAIAAQLLGLLVAFIGKPLTLRLVREAWPEISPEEWQRIEEGS